MLTLPTWLASFAIGWIIAGRALRPVRASFVLQRTFMADASHELRTPLAIIRAHAETALAGRTSHRDGRADAGRDPAADASLTTIVAASEELTRLLDDLLFLARADADAPPTQRLRFAFDELVEESVAWLVPLAHERGAALAFVGPADGAEIVVEADPDQLKRLVGLLVTNAVAHAGAVPIEVAVRRADGVAYLYVDDAGPGFASEVLPHAFDRFRRGVATQDGRIRGHGLGLAIARAIVAGHGGEVSLGKSPLGGARVTVALPTKARRPTRQSANDR
jgi:signal transduction histidine kinase